MEPYWRYEDLGIFFLIVVLLGPVLNLCARIHLFPQAQLNNPAVPIQIGIVLVLIVALYLVLKIRYRHPVWGPLGWTFPGLGFVAAAIIGGISMGAAVSFLAHGTRTGQSHAVSPVMVVLVTLLGPALEESIFRGFLFPLLSKAGGSSIAVAVTAVLFAVFHAPATVAQWSCVLATGLLYGCIRAASGSTLASAVAHSAYNAALLLLSQTGR